MLGHGCFHGTAGYWAIELNYEFKHITHSNRKETVNLTRKQPESRFFFWFFGYPATSWREPLLWQWRALLHKDVWFEDQSTQRTVRLLVLHQRFVQLTPFENFRGSAWWWTQKDVFVNVRDYKLIICASESMGPQATNPYKWICGTISTRVSFNTRLERLLFLDFDTDLVKHQRQSPVHNVCPILLPILELSFARLTKQIWWMVAAFDEERLLMQNVVSKRAAWVLSKGQLWSWVDDGLQSSQLTV